MEKSHEILMRKCSVVGVALMVQKKNYPINSQFYTNLGCFWPSLWPNVPKSLLYEAEPLVPVFGRGFNQKMKLSNVLYCFLIIFSPLSQFWANFGPFLASPLAQGTQKVSI